MLIFPCNSMLYAPRRVTHGPSNKVSNGGSCHHAQQDLTPLILLTKCPVRNTSAWPTFLSSRASFWDYRSTLMFFTCSEVRELIATAGTSKCGTTYRLSV
jgi:hypothetical protein